MAVLTEPVVLEKSAARPLAVLKLSRGVGGQPLGADRGVLNPGHSEIPGVKAGKEVGSAEGVHQGRAVLSDQAGAAARRCHQVEDPGGGDVPDGETSAAVAQDEGARGVGAVAALARFAPMPRWPP